MKLIVENKYIKTFSFRTYQESSTFVDKQEAKFKLSLNETYGDNFICYVCYDSLTQQKLFAISFESDEDLDNLNLLTWIENRLLVLDSGKRIYVIDDSLNIVSSLEITTPLVGLHVINRDSLLVLEEASMRIINPEGVVLKSELFDLMENFTIANDILFVNTSDGNKAFDLK